MHPEALEYVSRWGCDEPLRALDLGGRDINGHGRGYWPHASWTVLDIAPGPGVDIVADAATWQPDQAWDLVLCTEVFEHTASWRYICRTAWLALRPGGLLVATCAGPGRAPHSAIDGGVVHPGEYYGNVSDQDLTEALAVAGFGKFEVERAGNDTRAVAWR